MPDRLVILQRRLTHYRVPFFAALREHLADAGFELRLLVGEGHASERSKQDSGQLDWAVPTPCHYTLGGRLCWQAVGTQLRDAAFVVTAQENGLLHNLPLLLAPQRFRVALWGHGRNWQAGAEDGAASHIKRWLTRRADWWLAYTALSAAAMQRDVPASRITVLNNAVDTTALVQALQRARELPRTTLRRELGVGSGPLLLFMGSLYAEKRLDLLLDAAARLRVAERELQLVIAGDGPMSGWLHQRCAALPWIKCVGAVQGELKARWLAAADVMVSPGVLGLSVLDAFAAALPLVVGDSGATSPEAAYVEPDVNAVLAAPQAAALAQATLRVLHDADFAAQLRAGAGAAAQRYTLSAMVDHFVDGMQRWRASAPLRPGLRSGLRSGLR